MKQSTGPTKKRHFNGDHIAALDQIVAMPLQRLLTTMCLLDKIRCKFTDNLS